MKIKYTGGHPVLLMHEGKVWLVNPGDELELPSLPNLPNFEEVKAKKG